MLHTKRYIFNDTVNVFECVLLRTCSSTFYYYCVF